MIFVLAIILCIGGFSLYKIEKVYYTGFVDEMLKNIEGYDFNIGTESGNQESVSEDEMLKINTSGDLLAILQAIRQQSVYILKQQILCAQSAQ